MVSVFLKGTHQEYWEEANSVPELTRSTIQVLPFELEGDYYNNMDDYKIDKIYVSPLGVFSMLKDLESASKVHRRTVIRRFNNHGSDFDEWHVITEDTPLLASETCEVCDKVDDELFKEQCWLVSTTHDHSCDGILPSDAIKYLYGGCRYKVLYSEWQNGHRPHKTTIGDRE